jgi:tetratricopeptide (TPR) repeat protein
VSLRKMLVVAALALGSSLPTIPVSAQEVSADEAVAYASWHAASDAGDVAKATAAAEAYLKQFPSGQYADFLQKWLVQARFTNLDAAIKAQNIDAMLKVGREILAADPDNLNVLYALAFNLRLRELLANPQKFDHARDAQEFSEKAISLIDSGKTLAGVQNFDKNGTLAWLYQIQAILAANESHAEEAAKLYEKSTSLAPDDVGIAGRNMLAVLSIRQADYTEAARAYNALPEEARSAAEPSEEVKAARDRVDKEADGLIDIAARFVVFGKAKKLPATTIEKVNQVLESAYKTRFPEDTTLEGLQKILQEKGGAPAGA